MLSVPPRRNESPSLSGPPTVVSDARQLERYCTPFTTSRIRNRLFTQAPAVCVDGSPDGRPCPTRPQSLRTSENPCLRSLAFRIDRERQSLRDGGSSTDRTVINTDGAPARQTAEISSYVNVYRSILPNHPHVLLAFPPKQLQDPNGNIIARLQSVTPTKYTIGDVYRELHYIRSAGAGIVVSSLDPVELSFPAPACRG